MRYFSDSTELASTFRIKGALRALKNAIQQGFAEMSHSTATVS